MNLLSSELVKYQLQMWFIELTLAKHLHNLLKVLCKRLKWLPFNISNPGFATGPTNLQAPINSCANFRPVQPTDSLAILDCLHSTTAASRNDWCQTNSLIEWLFYRSHKSNDIYVATPHTPRIEPVGCAWGGWCGGAQTLLQKDNDCANALACVSVCVRCGLKAEPNIFIMRSNKWWR